MTPEQFAYWLQGYSELTGNTIPTAEQWQSIKDHLATVFHKMTPEIPKIYTPPKFTMPTYDPNYLQPTVIC